VLDLREVETIDAAGIGALLSLQAAGIYITLASPTDAVREIFRVTKLDSVFEICPDYFQGQAVATATGAGDSVPHGYDVVTH
jgi:anti-anti-sigma factor